MLNKQFVINLSGTENLSSLEIDAIKWFQILCQCEGDFRNLHQNVLPALLAIGSENPDLIIESTKTLASSNFVGSMNLMVARLSAGGLEQLAQSIPEIKLYLKNNHLDYFKEILDKRKLIVDNSWSEYIGDITRLIRLLDLSSVFIISRERFSPPNTEYDVYMDIKNIIKLADSYLQIIDPYADIDWISMIENVKIGVQIQIVATNDGSRGRLDLITGAKKYKNQYGYLELRMEDLPCTQHDRYIIVDKSKVFEIGSSLNHAGRKTYSRKEWSTPTEKAKILKNFEDLWVKLVDSI